MEEEGNEIEGRGSKRIKREDWNKRGVKNKFTKQEGKENKEEKEEEEEG